MRDAANEIGSRSLARGTRLAAAEDGGPLPRWWGAAPICGSSDFIRRAFRNPTVKSTVSGRGIKGHAFPLPASPRLWGVAVTSDKSRAELARGNT